MEIQDSFFSENSIFLQKTFTFISYTTINPVRDLKSLQVSFFINSSSIKTALRKTGRFFLMYRSFRGENPVERIVREIRKYFGFLQQK